MQKKIEYEGIGCTVFSTEKTRVRAASQALPDEVVAYAAVRWLARQKEFHKPLCRLCLAFRQGRMGRRRQLRLAAVLPARAAELPGGGYLHLVLALSAEGVFVERAALSPRPALEGLPAGMRRVTFHPRAGAGAKSS